MKTQFKSNIWINRSKVNQKGYAPIYIRITRDKRKIEISTGLFVDAVYWNNKKSEISNKHPESNSINESLAGYRRRIAQIQNQLILNDKYYDLSKIKDLIVGKQVETKTLIQVIDYHNKNMASLVGKSVAYNTLKNYIFFHQKIQRFMKIVLNKHDILLKDLDHFFLERFKTFMIVNDKNRPNTVLKNIILFRKIINMAVDYDWLDKSPFKRIKIDKDEPIRTYLNAVELSLVEDLVTDNKSLLKIRQMFVFQCYTGLAFIDLIHLQRKDIIIDTEGREWIKMNRQKTASYFSVPLLLPASLILREYALTTGYVFPTISNQKYNAGLKKLMKACGIDKQISSHSGRRTFATTVTLSNGVPIETVSRMLGHSDLSVTQLYAKVIDKKIMDDMKEIMDKI